MAIFTRIVNGQTIDASTFNNPMIELESAIENSGSLKQITSQQLASPAASFSVSGITQIYRDLVMIMRLGNNTLASADILVQFNGDTTAANYNNLSSRIAHSATLTTYQYLGTQTGLLFQFVTTYNQTGPSPALSYIVMTIPAYSLGLFHHVSVEASTALGSGLGLSLVSGVGQYTPNSTITQITVNSNGGAFVEGSAFVLYGRGV